MIFRVFNHERQLFSRVNPIVTENLVPVIAVCILENCVCKGTAKASEAILKAVAVGNVIRKVQ